MTANADSPGSIFIRFLKFGCLAWGGPAAQIAMIKRECVDDEQWISGETFKTTLAVYQVMPGPEAHELCVYFGRIRGGRLGGFLAGLGFMLPGFLLMLGLSVLYVEAEPRRPAGGCLLRAVGCGGGSTRQGAGAAGHLVRHGCAACRARAGRIRPHAVLPGEPGPDVLGAGLAYEAWKTAGRRGNAVASLSPIGLLVPVALAAVTLGLIAQIFLAGLSTGLLTFGGAYTAVPLLQESAVNHHHWLTQDQFVDGLALAGILPAPAIIFSTFVGYLAGGMVGALVITVGIFLPAFVVPVFLHRQLVAMANNERLRPFLLGVAAGVIGLIAAVGVQIAESGIVDPFTALLTIAAFLALTRFHGKLTVLYVVLGCGAIGAVVQLI